MSLADVVIPAEDVSMGGTTVRLRALSLAEISALFRDHAGTLIRAWEALAPITQDDDPVQAQTAIMALVGQSSDLIADVISIAADEPQSRDIAARLTIEMQFRAAITIFRLTLGTEDPQAILRDFQEAMGPAATLLTGTKH